MEDTGEPRTKLFYLEGLRGIAALVVVLSHFAWAFFPAAAYNPVAPSHDRLEPWLHNTPAGLLLAGNFAVCLFFAMSGYVLVRPFFLSGQRKLLLNAAVRRYLRLMPVVAAAVLSAFVLLKLGWFTNQAAAEVTGSHWLAGLWNFAPDLKVAGYQAFIGAFIDPHVTYDPPLWSMRTEFLGSMFVFAVAALVGRWRWRWGIYALLLILTAGNYFLGFVGGMILADYMATRPRRPKLTPKLVLGAVAGMMITGLLLGAYPSDLRSSVTWYAGLSLPGFVPAQLMILWHSLGALLVLVGVLAWPGARKALSHRWLVVLGKHSFSMYVCHLIIICTLGTAVFSRLHTQLGYHVSFAGTFVVTMAVIWGVSLLLTKFVDRPAIDGAKRAAAWLMHRDEPAEPGVPAGQSETPLRRLPKRGLPNAD